MGLYCWHKAAFLTSFKLHITVMTWFAVTEPQEVLSFCHHDSAVKRAASLLPLGHPLVVHFPLGLHL